MSNIAAARRAVDDRYANANITVALRAIAAAAASPTQTLAQRDGTSSSTASSTSDTGFDSSISVKTIARESIPSEMTYHQLSM